MSAVSGMLDNMLRVLRTNDAKLATATCRIDDEVDDLYTAIKLYLTRISLEALDERDGRRWTEIISLTINLEHAGDILSALGKRPEAQKRWKEALDAGGDADRIQTKIQGE